VVFQSTINNHKSSILKIAVTGGAGSGKTIVCSRLKALGLDVISADDAAKQAVVPGSAALQEIAGIFGKKILLPDGSLNRKMLRQIITEDDAARKNLESILHHEISKLILEKVAQLERKGRPIVVIEVPLLFELGLQGQYDRVVVVSASRESRIERLMARDNISREDAEKLIKLQMPDRKKLEGADYVVRNEWSKADLVKSVDVLFENLSNTATEGKST
jgi:dephospho-CoA kinase